MNAKIHCLIIDDEPLARQLIRALLLPRSEFMIIGECSNPVEAYELLLNNDIDVIFLDIQMPVISGVDFLRSLKRPPKVIFTTAHGDFATHAFNLNAVDYIVKPVTEERFEQAIEKLRLAFAAGRSQKDEELPAVDHIFLKADAKLVKVTLDEILYLEALKDFTKVHLRNEKTILVGDHLKAVESLLPGPGFVRIHRSYLVSIKAITGVFGNTVEIGKTQLPIGGTYKDDLFTILNIKRNS
jgi:two-component system LytT family response regulator